MKPSLLLDVDGVICDFIGGMIRSHGWDITPDDWTSWSHHHTMGITDKTFWEPTWRKNWWSDLQPYPGAVEFVRMLASRFEITFASAIHLNWSSGPQLLRWLTEHEFFDAVGDHRAYMLGERKSLLNGGGVLLDDYDDNCERFDRAGGRSIVYPQPWNSMRAHCANRIDYLNERLLLAEATR